MAVLLDAARMSRMPLTHAGRTGGNSHGLILAASNPPAAVRGIFICGPTAAHHSLLGVTGRYPQLRHMRACSESRPYTGKPGESRVARLSARVETWKPKVKLDGTRPVDSAATITREPSIAYGLSRLPVHRRACLMPKFSLEGS